MDCRNDRCNSAGGAIWPNHSSLQNLLFRFAERRIIIMKKELPIHRIPISNCYSADAGLVSILQAYGELNPALFEDRLYLFRKANKVLKFATLIKKDVYTCDDFEIDLIEWIIEQIKNGGYIFIYLDHYFLKASDRYKKFHFLHDFTLIYGYDLSKKILYCSDNFVDGKYSHAIISFSELYNARKSQSNEEIERNIENLLVYKYQKQECFLNLKVVKGVLSDYIYNDVKNIMKMNPDFLTDNIFGLKINQNFKIEDCVLGIRIYQWIIEYVISNAHDNQEIDIRPLHLLVNHQSILLSLVNYFKCNDLNLERYSEYVCILEEQYNVCIKLRNQALKYNITKDKKKVDSIIFNIKNIYHTEKKMLTSFLEEAVFNHI